MYGRANIFNREVANTNTVSYGGNSFQPNNNNNNYGSSNNNNNGNNAQKGSYRLEYKYEEPPPYLSSAIAHWKEFAPCSIATKEQIRVEDYFLIRKKQLKSLQDQKLRDAIKKQSFNEQLLKCESINQLKLHPFSMERPVDIDMIRSGRYNATGTNNNSGSNNSYGIGNGNGSNNNLFGNGNGNGNNNGNGNVNSSYNTRGNNANTTNNMFTSNSGSSNNTFMRNTNNGVNNGTSGGNNGTSGVNNGISSGNNASNNIFNARSGNTTGGNVFNAGNNNNGNTTGGNVFNAGNNNNGNTGNNNGSSGGSNNIFNTNSNGTGQNNNGGNSSNVFNNTNSGGTVNSSNIFNANNSGGIGNSANIFNANNNGNSSGSLFGNSNNNNSNNNGNNNGNNNNNNQGGSNIFSNDNQNNQNNQNNQGNNNFNNNNGQNGMFSNNNNGDYLYNSNGNNMMYNVSPSQFPKNSLEHNSLEQNLETFLCDNRLFLQMILAKTDQNFTLGNKTTKTQDINNIYENFDQTFRQYEYMQIDSHKNNRRSDSPQSKIVFLQRGVEVEMKKNIQPKGQMNYSRYSQNQRIVNNFTQSRIVKDQSQVMNSFSSYNEGDTVYKSKLLRNDSSIMSNSRMFDRQNDTYNRNETISRQTRYGVENKMKSKQPKELVYEQECELQLRLKVVWLDDLKNEIKQDRCSIEARVELKKLNTKDKASKQEIIKQLKLKFPFVRNDADLKIDTCFQSSNIFSIDGRLLQRVVNLNPPNGLVYKIYHSRIKNNMLFNLTISNENGTVSWERPIYLDLLDFKIDIEFAFDIGDNCISCEVEALNSACRVTFNNLPKQIKHQYNQNPENAKKIFSEIVQSNNRNFVFSQIWRSGENYGWTMTVSKFKDDRDKMSE